jgi:Xaa-Pro aminopeptidase
MSLEPPTEEALAAIRAACEIDEEALESAVTRIKEWLQQRPLVAPCFG